MAAAWGDDSRWQKIRATVSRAARAHVKVGVLSDGGGSHEGIGVVALAAIHEFGSPAAGVPERSFIRRTFTVHADELGKVTAKLAKKVVENAMPLEQALGILGAWGAAKVKGTIKSWTWAPEDGGLSSTVVQELSPRTIERKGSDRPLVDTGRMVDSITHQVVTE